MHCVYFRNSRRGDGGRYSMRFSGTNNKSHPTAVGRNDRPPFRVGGSARNQVKMDSSLPILF